MSPVGIPRALSSVPLDIMITRSLEKVFMILSVITKLNSILWDRDVTPKTKARIYHAVVKSTITYAAETWCLKAKTVVKLNFTEIDF